MSVNSAFRTRAFGTLVLLGTSVVACGRTGPIGAWSTDGGPADGPRRDGPRRDVGPRDVRPDLAPTDLAPTDLAPTDLAPTDLASPCDPGCEDLCELVAVKCAVMPYQICLATCPAWGDDARACAGKVFCEPTGADPCAVASKCLPAVPPPPGPDLTVSGFSAKVSGPQVTYGAHVCNIGLQAATGFYVDLYYDRQGPPAAQQYGEQFQQYAGLAPGACVGVSFTRAKTPAGAYTSWLQVDADGNVSEADEGNNLGGPVVVKVGGGPQPALPDLAIDSMSAAIGGPGGTTVRYRLRVCNVGMAAAGPFDVSVHYDRAGPPKPGDLGDKRVNVSSLAAGACADRDIYRTGTPPGSYSSYGQADPLGAVTESDEGNNTHGPVELTVGGGGQGVDLQIESFTGKVLGGGSSTTTRYRVRVCNAGGATAGATQLHIYFDRAGPPQPGQPGNQATTVPPLTAGSCTNRNIYRTGTPPGTYESWAQVDPLLQVSETDEGNNVAGPLELKVGSDPTLPDLVFAQLDAKVQGSDVYYSAVICNKSSTATLAFEIGFYHDRATAPPDTPGDLQDKLPGLPGGACATVNAQRNGAPAGTYNAWARVDVGNLVAEAIEDNNVAGPRTVVVAPAATGCAEICGFLIVDCGLMPEAQYWTCIGTCQALPPDKINCATNAKDSKLCMQAVNCMF